jgi:hypothetical protein
MNRARSFGSRSFAGIEIIEAAAQLERDHGKARLLPDGGGLRQLVADGSEASLCSLRRSVENDRGSEITAVLPNRVGIAFACIIERAVDLHLHDLEPWRKQPLRLLIGLEHRLQQPCEALPGVEAQPHQVLQLSQIGAQGADQQLDRDRRLPGRAGASDLVQSDDEAIDFRAHPARYVVAFLRGLGGEQRRCRSDETIGRTRDLHRADDLRHAGIDQLEPIADLVKCIDAGGRGQHGEGADPEECEQQPCADAKSPTRSGGRTIRFCYV